MAISNQRGLPVTREQNEQIGVGGRGSDAGLMLTGDENIVDIDFEVVWNIRDPAEYLFNLRDPQITIRAVAESAMREIIAQSELAPILNRDRGSIASRLQELIQLTLDRYGSGINVVRVNFDRADPPEQVIDAFREVKLRSRSEIDLKSRLTRMQTGCLPRLGVRQPKPWNRQKVTELR